jgi:hypothetical protein
MEHSQGHQSNEHDKDGSHQNVVGQSERQNPQKCGRTTQQDTFAHRRQHVDSLGMSRFLSRLIIIMQQDMDNVVDEQANRHDHRDVADRIDG